MGEVMSDLLLLCFIFFLGYLLYPLYEDPNRKEARKKGEPVYYAKDGLRSTATGKMVTDVSHPVYGYALREINSDGSFGKVVFTTVHHQAKEKNKEIEGKGKAYHYEVFGRSVLPVENSTGKAFKPHPYKYASQSYITYYSDPLKNELSGGFVYMDEKTIREKYDGIAYENYYARRW